MRFKKIYIEITNVCNLKCKFCLDTKRKKQYMNIDNFEKILSKIDGYTKLISLHIKGEPLMHPKLKAILELCEKYKIMVNITTNGTLLKENVEILKNNKSVRQINISLHSIKENNMNRIDYINNVFEAINEISDERDIIISYRLWNLSSISNNSINEDILIDLEKEYNICNLLEKAQKSDYVKLKNNIYLNQDIEFVWPSLSNEKISNKGKCMGIRNHIGILVNGDIVPCCLDQEGTIKLGNIYKNSLYEILNNNRCKDMIKGFQTNILVEELCKRCDYIKKFNK